MTLNDPEFDFRKSLDTLFKEKVSIMVLNLTNL